MPRCPRCGSDDVTPVVYSASRHLGLTGQAAASAVQSPPVDRVSPNHQCTSCQHAWPDQARLDTVDEIRSYFAALRTD